MVDEEVPGYLGDTEPRLHRISATLPDAASGLWLLTNEDLRRTARVRAFLEHMAEMLAEDRDLLEGRRPT